MAIYAVLVFIISEIRKEESIVGVIGDSAQAIYGFQGADIQLFKKYKVKTENEYSINENHRSDGEIVKFLNILRGNFTQIACETYAGALICLYTGNRNDAFQKAKEICVEEKLVSLSRDNITSNAMKIYPNIEENEEHRVYYVALSRAKKRLKINMESRLKKLLEIVKIFIF